jgi:hypothetical protein
LVLNISVLNISVLNKANMAWNTYLQSNLSRLFSLEKWKTRSKYACYALALTFLMALTALIVIGFAYNDINKYKYGEMVLVNKNHLVKINDQMYIPLKIIS